MLALDLTFGIMYFQRHFALAEGLADFELDPRAKPNFTLVFLYQGNRLDYL